MKKYLYLLSTASLLAFSTGTVLAEETVNNPDTVQAEPTAPTTTETATNTETPAPQPAEEEHQDISIEDYEKNVAGLQEVDIQTVYGLFTEEAKGENTLYVGRPTCIHCRLFSPTLKEFNNLIDGKLAYYNTDSEDFDQVARDFLFKTVGIPGTPTILHLVDGKLQAGWVGGGVTAEELYKALYKKDYVPKTNETEVPDTPTSPTNPATPIAPVVTDGQTPQDSRQTVQILSSANEVKPKQETKPQVPSENKPTVPDAETSPSPTPKLEKTSTSTASKTLPNTGDDSNLVASLLGLLSLSTAGLVFKKKY